MSEPVGRPLTIAMSVKLLACITVMARTTQGVKWDGGDVERIREAALQSARINVAASEVQRVLRVLEGEDSTEP